MNRMRPEEAVTVPVITNRSSLGNFVSSAATQWREATYQEEGMVAWWRDFILGCVKQIRDVRIHPKAAQNLMSDFEA